jgi:hypothetical protein
VEGVNLYRLGNLKISNFRSCRDIEVPLAGVTPLIGYNNAGKSNVLAACKWFAAPSALHEGDFADRGSPVQVEGTISGVTTELLEALFPQHRERLIPFVSEGSVTFRRRQVLGASVKQIELHVRDPANGEFQRNPAGIPQAFDAMFPEPITIGAMEIASDEVGRAKASNTIGKLLADLLAPIERDHGDEYRGQVQSLRDMLSADGASRAPALRQFDEDASARVSDFFPGIAVRVDVPLPEIKDIFKSGTIRVYEVGQVGRDLTSLGHGAQRCIQMALVRMLAERGTEKAGRTLLLVDEPELYLHPQAIELLRAAFRRLSMDGYQVVYSTHSPIMLDEAANRDVVLIRKDDTRGTYRRRTLPEAVERCARDREHQTELLFSLANASQVLFAEQVVLAEGKTEKHVLPVLFEYVAGKSLGASRTALVPIEGSGSIAPMREVIDALDLPSRVIADLDYVFQHRSTLNLTREADEALERCIRHLKVMEAEGICQLNAQTSLPEKSTLGTALDAFQKLAEDQRVRDDLDLLIHHLRSAGIWIWRRGAIEEHLGITQKTPRAWASLCDKVRAEGLDGSVADADAIRDLVRWVLA